ncbi:uncharacterized protein LOC108197409 [Daucus carota subsp. sativus]|nr:PREDICTED: micronuclear linker histone polyprotein-like [Daucus carota subsp. sativus]
MAASVEYRNMMKENEDDLSMFFEMRNRELGINDLSLIQNSDDFDDSFGSKPKITSIDAAVHGPKSIADEFLDSENGKTDYDWLLTLPCAPLEKGVVKTTGNAKFQTTAPRSKCAEPPLKSASSEVTSYRQRRSASAGTRRSSSSGVGGSVARPATPTGRPTLPALVKPLRSSTPSSRTALVPSSKIVAPHKRSSTPTRSTARSSTPTGRPSILASSKSASRCATPSQSSDQSSLCSASAPAGRSSSVTRSSATTNKKTIPSRAISPSAKSTSQRSEVPGFLTDAPPNLRTSSSRRHASASKERPCAPNSQPSTAEAVSSGKPRQKPYTSLKSQVSSGNSQNSGRPVIVKSRKYFNANDDVNPVLMGTQMVERVVNMRKLAPPKQDDLVSDHSNSKKSSSQESSGFGRSLSKKSLDMAIRHMDIGRSISGNMRSLMKDVPASSVYSLRSKSTKVGISKASQSLITSSNASSERSFNTSSHDLNGSEVEDIDLGSEQGHSSSNSQRG